jgi:hypothetical protein
LRSAAAPAAAVLLTVAFAAALGRFVWQPGLASFADDSVSYLVMAQVFSPWQPAAAAVAEAFRSEAFYPPLFPLLLALGGAAHDVARAHAATALLLAACLPLVYLLGVRWLENRWAALAAMGVTALLPATWINAKGILSEPLYCLALLACLLALDGERRRWWALAFALAALALTRTAGLALVAAYGLWVMTRFQASVRERAKQLLPAALAGAAYGVWVLLRPAEAADVNVRLLGERLGELSLARQASSIGEAWTGSLILYWVQGRPFQILLAGLVGLLSLAGLALRLRAGRADAWLLAAYLVTFLAWPFSDQMGRFIFPALPVLVLYAFWTVGRAGARLGKRPVIGYALLGLLFVALAGPPLAFIHQRSRMPVPHATITDWYRTPDLREARIRAGTHLELLDDMRAIQALLSRCRPTGRPSGTRGRTMCSSASTTRATR